MDNPLSLGFQLWAQKIAEGRRQALLFPLASGARKSNLIQLKVVLIHNICYRFLTCNKTFSHVNLKLFLMSQMSSEVTVFPTVHLVAQAEHSEFLFRPLISSLNCSNTNGHQVLTILPPQYLWPLPLSRRSSLDYCNNSCN